MDSRYSRQILFPGIGRDGQKSLGNSRVTIVGCGALGAAHAGTLARAGVGFIRLVDRDFVEFSNLQRQSLYSEQDAIDRIPKAVAARKRLTQINSEIEVESIVTDVDHTNIENIVSDVDVILDGTDNFQIRYLINDACVKLEKPWIYGAAVSSYGTTMTVIPGTTPCLRCIFEEIPAAGSSPTCDTAGVIQPIIAAVSAVQTTETIKLLTDQRDKLHNSLLQIDIWNNDWRKIKLKGPNSDCIACSQHVFSFLEVDDQELFTTLCGRDAVQVKPPNAAPLDLEKLATGLSRLGEIKVNEYLLRFEADGYEVTVFKDARAIIKGTDDRTTARSVYSRFIGS